VNKIPAREVQVFAAGAFALWGGRALIWLPAHFFATQYNTWWASNLIGALVTGLALPLGVGILLEKAQAIHWTKIFLWWCLGLTSVSAVILQVTPLGSGRFNYVRFGAPDVITCIVLLWLFSSPRFRHESAAER
jgi:hypothetical protein